MHSFKHFVTKMTAPVSPLYYVMCSKVNLNLLSKCLFSTNVCCESVSNTLINTAKKKLFTESSLWKNYIPKRQLTTNLRLYGVLGPAKATGGLGLSKQQAEELTLKLTTEERGLLLDALQEYQSKIVKDEYLGQLAANRWRSKFGRPSKLPTLGDVDPTGSFCPVPEDWLRRKCGFWPPCYMENTIIY